VRLREQELIGFVQATVLPGNKAYVAYVLHSHYWRRGLGSAAVTAMLAELESTYAVLEAYAVLKEANFRSVGLLAKLGFRPLGANVVAPWEQEPDEVTMAKSLSSIRHAA
jgi:[ribosomal protein S5]-alanine N-acetyltransferase